MVVNKDTLNKELSSLELRIRVKKFLNELCVKDRKGITESVHRQMMKAHIYYVDYQNQGWYVLNDSTQFFRELEVDEWEVYGELWEKAVAYE